MVQKRPFLTKGLWLGVFVTVSHPVGFNVDFHMAEYGQLRSEIEMHIADRRKVETQNVIAIIGIYAWLLSRPSDAGLNPIWTFPVFVPAQVLV